MLSQKELCMSGLLHWNDTVRSWDANTLQCVTGQLLSSHHGQHFLTPGWRQQLPPQQKCGTETDFLVKYNWPLWRWKNPIVCFVQPSTTYLPSELSQPNETLQPAADTQRASSGLHTNTGQPPSSLRTTCTAMANLPVPTPQLVMIQSWELNQRRKSPSASG